MVLLGRVLVAAAGAMLVHEHGHLLVARLLGLRPTALMLGWGKPWLRLQVGSLTYSLGARFWAFGAVYYQGGEPVGARLAWLAAAGALANAVVALLVVPGAGGMGLALTGQGPFGNAQLWIIWNLLLGLVSLLPGHRGGAPSDGTLLWRALRQRGAASG